MELYIDNRQADLEEDASVSISLAIATLTDPLNSRTGYTKSFRIPMTARNREIMGDTEQLHNRDLFNHQTHTARIEERGAIVMEGRPVLTGCERIDGKGQGWYQLNIIGPGKEWVTHASETTLRQTGIDYSFLISDANIVNSWTNDTPVRFLPVQRDTYASDQSNGVIPALRILSFDDYHPFLHLGTLIRAIFADAGYRLVSEFIESRYFDSFYMSGRYPTRDVSVIRSKMDFLAKRFAPVTATATYNGIVYADPYLTGNTIGNLVETANPEESRDGVTCPDVFDRGGCFQMDGKRIMFKPTEEVSVGFVYHLKYTSDFYMLSRTELKGFNEIYVDYQSPRKFRIPNAYPDRKQEFRSGQQFRIVVFDHTEGNEYQLRYTSGSTTAVAKNFSTRSELVGVASGNASNPTLYYRPTSNASYALYPGDWALYDGFVEERGTTLVEITLRTAPEELSPSNPKYFDFFCFRGAEEGMQLTVSNETYLQPAFYPHPSVGSEIAFADVAAHEIHQIDVIRAVKHLFGLCFYTDVRSRTVYAEPLETFYRDEPIVDWSDRIDFDKPIVIEELGADMKQLLTWDYQSGDGTVSRWNQTNGERFGAWSASLLNRSAEEGETTFTNPLFTPSMNRTGDFTPAPSASLLQVGDRDADRNEMSPDLNFPPKIVRYIGPVQLPEGEVWSWPSDAKSYPFVAFHHPGTNNPYAGQNPNPESSYTDDPDQLLNNGFSLCFEDRDGVAGLHRFPDRNVTLYNHSRRVSLWVRIDPDEVERLNVPETTKRDFRAAYRLDIDGERGIYMLEQVCDYNPKSEGSTRCIFIKKI